jgi:folate-dependent phosphoribosylglycinamide formyltransferase PurN
MYWIALFSQTGSELSALQKELGVSPDIIFTNSKMQWSNDLSIKLHSKHDDLMNELRKFNSNDIKLITLHGYLRILPEDICTKFSGKIFNGHPGAIDVYPELKGKDPQIRVWNEREKYRIIGSVVHEVTPIVDDGKIMNAVHFSNRARTESELFAMLKDTSIQSWKWFLRRQLCV